jgi:hypothetical protein
MNEPIYHNADGDVISEQDDEDIATQRELLGVKDV